MSWPVALELLQDEKLKLRHEPAWLDGVPGPLPAIAAIPSVTSASRMSLFSGALGTGNQAEEKRAFEGHPTLLKRCDRKHPPLLLHKDEVTERLRGPLSEEVAKIIRAEDKVVVGAVINAIDENLSTAHQVVHRWSLETIRPLPALLEAAREGGRVVVIASDHGHVCIGKGRAAWSRTPGTAGGRWPATSGTERSWSQGRESRDPEGRKRSSSPGTRASGTACRRTGTTVALRRRRWSLLSSSSARRMGVSKGLTGFDIPEPSWWHAAPEGLLPPVPVEKPETRVPTGPDAYSDLPIFSVRKDETPRTSRPEWIVEIFGSETYVAQKQLARHAPPDDEIRRCLEILYDHGGAIAPAGLAQKLEKQGRLEGFLAKVQRVLNFDGYEVLLLDRERSLVQLDFKLLLRQFGLE